LLPIKIKIGITNKLLILSFFFIFIFYGTILILFVNVQKLLETSEGIVNTNNKVSTLSKEMLDNLLNMEINDKKFRLLKKTNYLTYFKGAEKKFIASLEKITKLDSPQHQISSHWANIHQSYQAHISHPIVTIPEEQTGTWADEKILDEWMKIISIARRENQNQIENSLVQINVLGKLNFRYSIIGLGITIFMGILGAVFISRSMIIPLKKLKNGLQNVSDDNYSHVMDIKTGDEFGELAAVFNEMSQQLQADETIRSDFIATLSHEIRTPLSSTKESVNLIAEEVFGPVNADQKKFLTIAGDELSRITNLLNHLLNISMLESNTKKADPKSVDPNLLIKEASKGLISKEKLKNVVVNIHEDNEVPSVLCRKNEIIQVLINVIGNAVKFSDPNSFVTVNMVNEKTDPFLIFKISDQGPGIPIEEQALIFKRYYRAKGVRKHQDGVGLGLNISKNIIRSHGGTIFMKNNMDRGCSFYFTLPKEK